MQAAARRPTPAIVFDSSIEGSIGQVLALSMLLVYESKREARLTSLTVSRNNLKLAAFCDLMGRFHGAPLSIGMFDKSATGTNLPPMIANVLTRQTPDGKLAYARVVERHNDTADPVALIRNALSAQQDQNSVVVLSGPPTNLLGTLALPGNKQLIQRKVRTLILAGPYEDAASFAKLLADWPSPIVFVGDDLALRFPAEAIETDFKWAANHPLVDAYRAAGTMPYDATATAMAAALYAARPEEAHFKLSEPGVLTVLSNGSTQFRSNSSGRHRQLLLDAAQTDRVVQVLRSVVSSRPPEPRRGARGPQP
jgi:hypothetical protein